VPPLAADAAGIDAAFFQRFTSFYADFMPPAIAEVVFVAKAFIVAEFEITQSNLIGIGRETDTSFVVDTIVLAMDMKHIQMLIAPTKGNLYGVMQISDRAVAAHQKPAPDHGTDLVNPNVESVNLGTGFVCHHCLSVANNHQNCESITPAPGLFHSPL
jgi:hypothetical protein